MRLYASRGHVGVSVGPGTGLLVGMLYLFFWLPLKAMLYLMWWMCLAMWIGTVALVRWADRSLAARQGRTPRIGWQQPAWGALPPWQTPAPSSLPPWSPPVAGPQRVPVPDAVRQQVMARDGYRCRWCGAVDQLEIDHVLPVARGGTNDPTNLQVLCRQCNSFKSSRIIPNPWEPPWQPWQRPAA